MKKSARIIFILLLAMFMIFALAACPGDDIDDDPPPPTATVPGQPRGLMATAGDKEISIVWSAPTDNGGKEITKYEVSCGTSDDAAWVDATSNTNHKFSGLTNGTTYTVKVRAVNEIGSGAAVTTTAKPTDPPVDNSFSTEQKAILNAAIAEFKKDSNTDWRFVTTVGETVTETAERVGTGENFKARYNNDYFYKSEEGDFYLVSVISESMASGLHYTTGFIASISEFNARAKSNNAFGLNNIVVGSNDTDYATEAVGEQTKHIFTSRVTNAEYVIEVLDGKLISVKKTATTSGQTVVTTSEITYGITEIVFPDNIEELILDLKVVEEPQNPSEGKLFNYLLETARDFGEKTNYKISIDENQYIKRVDNNYVHASIGYYAGEDGKGEKDYAVQNTTYYIPVSGNYTAYYHSVYDGNDTLGYADFDEWRKEENLTTGDIESRLSNCEIGFSRPIDQANYGNFFVYTGLYKFFFDESKLEDAEALSEIWNVYLGECFERTLGFMIGSTYTRIVTELGKPENAKYSDYLGKINNKMTPAQLKAVMCELIEEILMIEHGEITDEVRKAVILDKAIIYDYIVVPTATGKVTEYAWTKDGKQTVVSITFGGTTVDLTVLAGDLEFVEDEVVVEEESIREILLDTANALKNSTNFEVRLDEFNYFKRVGDNYEYGYIGVYEDGSEEKKAFVDRNVRNVNYYVKTDVGYTIHIHSVYPGNDEHEYLPFDRWSEKSLTFEEFNDSLWYRNSGGLHDILSMLAVANAYVLDGDEYVFDAAVLDDIAELNIMWTNYLTLRFDMVFNFDLSEDFRLYDRLDTLMSDPGYEDYAAFMERLDRSMNAAQIRAEVLEIFEEYLASGAGVEVTDEFKKMIVENSIFFDNIVVNGGLVAQYTIKDDVQTVTTTITFGDHEIDLSFLDQLED